MLWLSLQTLIWMKYLETFGVSETPEVVQETIIDEMFSFFCVFMWNEDAKKDNITSVIVFWTISGVSETAEKIEVRLEESIPSKVQHR